MSAGDDRQYVYVKDVSEAAPVFHTHRPWPNFRVTTCGIRCSEWTTLIPRRHAKRFARFCGNCAR